MPSGRFAPSPTGRLHLGNLRTALVAWLTARSDGSTLHLRFDDLDTGAVRPEHYRSQVDDLRALGLHWDGAPIRQSDRLAHYHKAVETLRAGDLVYSCYCSRREIREAAQAPNRPFTGRSYPGTCRTLSTAEQKKREAGGRQPALRVRTDGERVEFVDLAKGRTGFEIDDFVIRRNDGTPAYHLVTVVDDAAFDVSTVVRADDLLDSTSRQLHLAQLLGLAPIEHLHVPLVLGPDGDRLAKRHGAVTLADRAELGEAPSQVLSFLAASLELCEPGEAVTPPDLLERFDPRTLPTDPLVLADEEPTS